MLHIEINRVHSDVFVMDGANGCHELSIEEVRAAFPYFIPKTNNIWTYRSTLDEKKYDELCKHIICSVDKMPCNLHDVIYHPHKTFGKNENELHVSIVIPYLKAGLIYANENKDTLKHYVSDSMTDICKFINWLITFLNMCESEEKEAYLLVEHDNQIIGNLP